MVGEVTTERRRAQGHRESERGSSAAQRRAESQESCRRVVGMREKKVVVVDVIKATKSRNKKKEGDGWGAPMVLGEAVVVLGGEMGDGRWEK